MSFLAPWFLLGTLAVAGPVLFHLIRRSARQRMPFSSLLFLRPTPPRATRRRKLEHIALLLLRCLGLLLLAAAFARPFFLKSSASPPPDGEGRQTIVLLDTSASMRREGLWSRACAVARRYLEKASLADRVAVLLFDQQPRTLVSFADWSSWPVDQRAALARQRLDAVSPGWAGTHLGLALTSAAEQFADDTSRAGVALPGEVALISDLQEGSKLDGLQGHDWPKGIRVIIERVDPTRRGNAGLEILGASGSGAGDAIKPRVRVVNARDSTREKFLLGWNAEGAAALALQARANLFASWPKPDVLCARAANGSRHGHAATDGRRRRLSTMRPISPPPKGGARPSLISVRTRPMIRSTCAITCSALFRKRRADRSKWFRSSLTPSASLDTLNRAALAVIPGSLDAAEVTPVRDWLAGGKTALLVLTNAQSGATLAALAGGTDLEISEAAGDYALLGEVDFTHPIFAPFSDPRFSDFSRIHFWKHRRWTIPPSLPARVLAKFDDGAPALAQITIGKGNLLVLAAGWNPAESQFAVSSKFLPLMQTLLDWSGSAAPARTQFQTGEAIPSPVSSGDALQWQKPDGKVIVLAAGASLSPRRIFRGFIRRWTGTKSWRFAVNLPLDESRTAPLSPDDLARLGVPLQAPTGFAAAKSPEAKRLWQQEELENRQKAWRWLILGVLAVAFVEIVLAGSLARRVRTLEVTP